MSTQPKPTKIIFDMDGTLYPFSVDGNVTFTQTAFYTDLCERIIQFVRAESGISRAKAKHMLAIVDRKYKGELSIGFEREYGVDRYRYYRATWGCEPHSYILPDAALADALRPLTGKVLLLTAAPRAWADKVLAHLGIADIFGEQIITGEPDLRKPSPEVFKLAAERLGAQPHEILSVGDQNATDILPAKTLGMTTLIVGPHQHDADHRTNTIHDAIQLITKELL